MAETGVRYSSAVDKHRSFLPEEIGLRIPIDTQTLTITPNKIAILGILRSRCDVLPHGALRDIHRRHDALPHLDSRHGVLRHINSRHDDLRQFHSLHDALSLVEPKL